MWCECVERRGEEGRCGGSGVAAVVVSVWLHLCWRVRVDELDVRWQMCVLGSSG